MGLLLIGLVLAGLALLLGIAPSIPRWVALWPMIPTVILFLVAAHNEWTPASGDGQPDLALAIGAVILVIEFAAAGLDGSSAPVSSAARTDASRRGPSSGPVSALRP
ncbi:MAG TPA: hypothetical protein VIJ15_10030 [Dermatophilaceae bacterium]